MGCDTRRISAHTLFARLYDELRRIATDCLRHEPPDHTLMPPAVVNEAYLRLRDRTSLFDRGRTRFFAIATRTMRQVLVDHARRRRADKRGGGWNRISISDSVGATDRQILESLALEQALEKLASDHPRAARIVELRFFSGHEEREIAAELDVSRTTVQGEWRFARAWLHRELDGFELDSKPGGDPA